MGKLAGHRTALIIDTWTTFKTYLNGTKATLAFIFDEEATFYRILTEDYGGIHIELTLSKTAPASADQTDFETNFKPLALRKTGTQQANGLSVGGAPAGSAASPVGVRLSDGNSFYDGAKTGQLPSALVGGRLDGNVGAWLGSTAPTVGQKTSAQSVPMVLASDQSAVPVSLSPVPRFPSFYAVFDRIVPAANKYMAVVWNTSATAVVRIYRVFRFNWQYTAVTGVQLEQYLARITAQSGGTAVTVRKDDTGDTLAAGVSAVTGPTAVTEDHILRRFPAVSEEVNITLNNIQNLLGYEVNKVYEKAPESEGLVLRQNQGVAVRNVTSSIVGSVSYVIEFSVEGT